MWKGIEYPYKEYNKEVTVIWGTRCQQLHLVNIYDNYILYIQLGLITGTKRKTGKTDEWFYSSKKSFVEQTWFIYGLLYSKLLYRSYSVNKQNPSIM